MNANRNNTKQNMGGKKGVPKPYCKVCHDAGKSEVEYTSHWVKNKPGPDGVVICPTLLAQECRYCHESGHTPSCCKKLERDNKVQAKRDHERERAKRIEQSRIQEAAKKPQAQAAKCGGGFAALSFESSDSDESPRPCTRPVEAFPALCPASRSLLLDSATPAAGSYASMAVKTKFQFEMEQSKKENDRLRAQMQSLDLERYVPKVRTPKVYKPVAQRSWADDSDWESDDEDEDVAVEDAW